MYKTSCQHVKIKNSEKEKLTFSLAHKRQVPNIKQICHFKFTDHKKANVTKPETTTAKILCLILNRLTLMLNNEVRRKKNWNRHVSKTDWQTLSFLELITLYPILD